MNIDSDRTRQIMRYAVAVASNGDDLRRRELGPIHLIKYVYLADLAYAESQGGVTFTGIPWRFYHFGPWAPEAWREIEPAMDLQAIRRRSFQGRYQDDVSRWRSEEPELEECLERDLPFVVAQAVRSAVHDFANDTSGLLHHVYRTPPMLRAAPEERLDFTTVVPEDDEPVPAKTEETPQPPLSKTARKRRKQAHNALRVRFQEALRKSRRTRPSKVKPRPPRYDEVFARGQEWLDSLAGEPIESLEGELLVSEAIWKSPTRSEPRIP